MIQFDDFKKLDLRIATVVGAEKIEGSDKLLKLQIDLGEEKRQLVSGIAKFYAPEEMLGKQVVMIANLEPRTILGLESQGMLLAVDDQGAVLLTADREVTPGAKVS